MIRIKKRPTGFEAAEIRAGATSEPCGCGQSELPRLASITTDPLEVLSIVLMRHVMAGHCWPELGYLDAGLDRAEAVLGPLDGPSVYARNLALMRALEREREGNFQFMAPGCDRISEDEQELAAALQASRRQPGRIETAVGRLTRRPNAPRTMLTIGALAAMLDRLALVGHGDARVPASATLH